jgi:hypothetical protein
MKRKLLLILIGICVLHNSNAQGYRTPDGNTDYHHFVRAGGGAAVYINQVSTGNFPILRLSSGTVSPNSINNVKFSVENNGNVGIGSTRCSEKLTLYKAWAEQVATQYGNVNTGIASGNGFIVGIETAGNGVIWNREDSFLRFGTSNTERMRIMANGNVGIGTNSPNDAQLQVEGPGTYDGVFRLRNTGNNGADWSLVSSNENWTAGAKRLLFTYDGPSSDNTQMVLTHDGKLGVGTYNLTGTHRLYVAGSILTEEVHVKSQNNWPDYVFKEEYELPGLEEVEEFVAQKGHLPNIPSQEEVAQNGYKVAEMNAKLLQKIEELTLYLIQQQKQIKQLQAKVEQM